ncbi:Rrf2 family transcriptional regulator [Deinococcus hopiensis]|uniref:Rrf2 family protein n=1 Tax=Deinococcus hopiensis KR-140 TaxID=695939 RepID=A0A1W1VF82_9DEIO|nr:Rrf2 family transcriptional regulator [Deinococcus hopiensis]SMB91956.1 Rrf2 family protein [Deinococcus hopiensis KR-140]
MNSQYSIAVHILALLNAFPGPMSSEDVAGSVGVNPVVIRHVTGLLRRAGLLETQRGVPGARLTRPPSQITLLDVYRAVEAPESVLKLHGKPNLDCPVGARIQGVLDDVFGQAQAALEARLAQVRLSDVNSALMDTG